MDHCSEDEIEKKLQNLVRLRAKLEADEPDEVVSQCSSKTSVSTSSRINTIQSKLDTAISLNKMTFEKLCRLEKILTIRLQECKQKLNDVRAAILSLQTSKKEEKFRYISCGKPYFKDKSNFPAPDNDDTILMAKSNMYDFSHITSVSGWTAKDKTSFMTMLQEMTQDIRRNELNSKIAQLKREMKVKDRNTVEKEISVLKKQIQGLKKMPFSQLALPIDQEYDWDTLANKLNHRHFAQEYQALWKLYLHPSINKGIWSKNEHNMLLQIGHKNKFQHWDNIAKQLNTGRTSYQCFVYFRTNMTNTFTGQKWTKEEEEYLKRLIDYYREDSYIPWGRVAASMENRTKIQIYNKYTRLFERRKGRFLPEEDGVILTCFDKYGNNYKKMSEYLPGRSIVQIRSRYDILSKRRTSLVWTEIEDKKLMQLMANQDSHMLQNFAMITKYFPGKDRVALRGRYRTLMKWAQHNPNQDISKAPRRGSRRLGHGFATDSLNKAVQNLKNRMEVEVESKKKITLTRLSSEKDIEDAIIAALVTENVKGGPSNIDVDEDNPSISRILLERQERAKVLNLKNILLLLNARLNKNKFKNSDYVDRYPGLLHENTAISQVKSYSKKNVSTAVQTKELPDVWGSKILGSSTYVFPPNYATITACKVLMTLISSNSVEMKVNLNLLKRRNKLLREQYECAMDRFNFLFVWPMLLSNEGPSENITRPLPTPTGMSIVGTKVAPKKNLYEQNWIISGVTIPTILHPDSESIDLEEQSSPHHINIEEDFNTI